MPPPAQQLDEDYERNFARLTNASRGAGLQPGQKARDKLKEEWQTTEIPMQHRLAPNLESWKRTAEKVDLGYDMAREPR
jgi:hypothetical protein